MLVVIVVLVEVTGVITMFFTSSVVNVKSWICILVGTIDVICSLMMIDWFYCLGRYTSVITLV